MKAIEFSLNYSPLLCYDGLTDDLLKAELRDVIQYCSKEADLFMVHTFIVTTMEMAPYQVIQFYCGRGKMENFLKEGKNDF